jgi:hypothetical protein
MIIILSYIYYFVASSAASLKIRWLTKKKDLDSKDQVLFTFQIMFILFLGSLLFPFFSRFYISENHLYLLFLSLICGIFGIGANLFSNIAQKHVEAGATSIINNIYTPITIILSSLFLHEGLTPLQIIGTVCLLLAMFIISKKHRTGRFSFDKYFLLMLLSGIMLGFLLVAERALQKTTGFSAGVMMSWGSQAFFLGLVALFTRSKQAYTNKEVLGMGVIRFIAATSYVVLVYMVGNLSFVSSVITFKVVIIFISAAIFLKEREDIGRKIFGSLLAILGLLFMR